MNADGSQQRNLTRDGADDGSPAWHPNGEWIVFSSNRDGDYELYVMDVDGRIIEQLTDNDVDDQDPTWGPDDQIAFSASAGRTYELLITSLDGAARALSRESVRGGSPNWWRPPER